MCKLSIINLVIYTELLMKMNTYILTKLHFLGKEDHLDCEFSLSSHLFFGSQSFTGVWTPSSDVKTADSTSLRP